MLRLSGVAASGLLLASETRAAEYPSPSPVDSGHVEGGRVLFDPWRAPADAPSSPPPAPLPPEQRVGFAVIGLGRLALEQILPAFVQSKRAKLVGLVSGSAAKMQTVAAQYGVPDRACADYAGFEQVLGDPAVQAAYIVLPNGMHREFVGRTATAGKHVLCEKPMATNSADARAMVAACAAANVKLMVAYRIQYEPYNLRAMRFVRDGTFGRLVAINAINTQTVAADGAAQWRHKRALSGGGSLPDIGLYCLNTARFLTGEEPVELWASTYSPANDPRFAEVEETVSFTLRFPSGTLANCLCSYGARDDKHQRLELAEATVDMPNAYQYHGQRMVVSHRTGNETGQTELDIPPKNQFAEEIDHFAECVATDKRPRTPGEEGVQDHVLMEAIYASARGDGPVRFPLASGMDAFRSLPPKEG